MRNWSRKRVRVSPMGDSPQEWLWSFFWKEKKRVMRPGRLAGSEAKNAKKKMVGAAGFEPTTP